MKKCLGKFNREDDWKISNVREPIIHKIKRTGHEKKKKLSRNHSNTNADINCEHRKDGTKRIERTKDDSDDNGN